jgi:hypothetical protein
MFCLGFGQDGNDNDHSVRRANTARAHARWRHLVASHEATDTLHQVTCLVPYLPSGMVVAIAVESVTLYYIKDNNYTLIISNYTVILMINTKPSLRALAQPLLKRLLTSDWADP